MSIAVPKPSVGDASLAAILMALGQLTTWLQLDSPDAFAGSRLANGLLLALGTLPALWRRFAPAGVVAVSAAVLCLPHTVAELDVTVLGQFVPLIVVTASCGYHASAGRALVGAALSVAGMLAVSWTSPFLHTPTSLMFNLLVLLAPWAAARALRHREERARRLGAALAHERTQFEGRMAEAVERERAEIARDLHDIVAHGVSVMVVQIGGARMQLAENPDRAAKSLLDAEDAGRQALADLRRMLGVLRASPATTTTTTADTGPRPGLRHLETLIKQTGNAGLDVQSCAEGSLDGLPPAIDVSAYRIVQEAITNVLKHSRADHAHLRIDITDRLLSITVRDRGPKGHKIGGGARSGRDPRARGVLRRTDPHRPKRVGRMGGHRRHPVERHEQPSIGARRDTYVIKVLIVDDEHLVRGGLKMILDAQPDIEVVGEAEDGAQAVTRAKALRPDVILLDVQMPVMNGLDAATEILNLPDNHPKVIMVTTFDLDEYVHTAIAAGASGFLLKDTRAEVLADAVRTVAGGEALVAPSILRRLVAHHSSAPATAGPSHAIPGVQRLTEREFGVFRLLGRGFSNQEIARELWISESTVKTHVTRVFAKLGLRDRAQAVVLAYESGLVSPGDSAHEGDGDSAGPHATHAPGATTGRLSAGSARVDLPSFCRPAAHTGPSPGSVGIRNQRDGLGARTEPRQATALRSWNK